MRKRIRKAVIASAAMTMMTVAAAMAQEAPVYSVPSPEAANLGIYGSVPVSLFTGVPDISVPLYEMKAGSMSFPISMNYHLSSVKPNQYPGKVGLGWSLQCGGCISRTVRGVPDEKKSGSHENGYYYNHSLMSGITTSQFDMYTEEYSQREDGDWLELSADEFSFNFFGHSGNFYLSPEGEWVVVSDEDIKLEFDPEVDILTMSNSCDRIPNFGHWPNRDNNRRHFIRFTLVTPDGCRYTFGGLYATDFSVPYYSRDKGDLIATSWHLSNIRTADGRDIRYEYEERETDLMVDIRYSPSKKQTESFFVRGDNGVNIGRRGFTGFLLFPARLNRIVAVNETIDFEYKRDWRYCDAYSDGYAGEALYWSDGGYSRTSMYQIYGTAAHMQFTFLFPDFDRSTDAVARSQIASDLRASVLYGIRIDTRGGDDTTILMDYLEQARRKLSRLVWRSGLVNIETTYLHGGGVMYPRYSIPDETSGIDMPEYRFSYDPGRMPHGYILPQADRWGYWNGVCHSLGSYPSELPSSVNATRSESLTGITFPTGGKSIFEYEGNDYSKIEDDNHGLIDVSGMSGGLRVRSVTNVSRDDRIVSKKVYHYRQTMDSPSLSSGISRLQDPTTVTYGMKIPLAQPLPGGTAADSLYVSLTMSGMYGFGLPVTNMNTPDTGYSCVIEETLDEEGNSLGYVVNRFSNFDTDIHGQTHTDTVAYHHHNHMRTGPGIPYTSNSSERGKLMSRTWCKGDGTEVKSEVYRYAKINERNIPTATQRTVFINSDPAYLIQLSMAWLTSTNTSSYMLVSTTVREGDYSDSTWTCYNQRRQPTSESVLASDGTSRTVCYTYAEDHPQQYGWMVDSHILSPVVTSCLSCGDLCRTTVNTYSDAGDGSGHIPYVSKVETVHGEDGPAETDYEVVSTDRWGNPTEIIRNGVHSVLQWSRNGQCLRTVAENMTLSEYEALPEFISHAQTQSDDTEEYPFIMDPAERDASGLYVWNYNYDARLNLVRMTSPEGLMSYYSYDVLGRLAEEKVVEETGNGDFEIKTVKKYSYHYQKD